jgi:hypothetical protein
LGGGSSAGGIDGGGQLFRERIREPEVGFEWGKAVTVSRRGEDGQVVAMVSWPSGRRRKVKGRARVSVREREGGRLGRAGWEAKAQEEWGRGWPAGPVEGEAGRGEEGEVGWPKAMAQAAGPKS